MEHYDETISKFLEALNVDSIKDVRYQGKNIYLSALYLWAKNTDLLCF